MNKPLPEVNTTTPMPTVKSPEGPENNMVCDCGYRAKESVFKIEHKHCPTAIVWGCVIFVFAVGIFGMYGFIITQKMGWL